MLMNNFVMASVIGGSSDCLTSSLFSCELQESSDSLLNAASVCKRLMPAVSTARISTTPCVDLVAS